MARVVTGAIALYDELLGEGVTMIAPPNPLRGLSGGDGEYLTDLQSKFPPPGIIPYIVQHTLPDGGDEFTLAPEGFHESFCADIPADDAAFYAITQRPSPASRDCDRDRRVVTRRRDLPSQEVAEVVMTALGTCAVQTA